MIWRNKFGRFSLNTAGFVYQRLPKRCEWVLIGTMDKYSSIVDAWNKELSKLQTGDLEAK